MQAHEMDQVEAALRDMAIILANYKKQLIKAGFSSMETIALVVAYQTSLVSNRKK